MFGIFDHRVVIKSINNDDIHGDVRATIPRTATILGTNVSVCSCICVIAWNKLITNPIASPSPTAGIDNVIVSTTALYNICDAKSCVIFYLKLSINPRIIKFHPSASTNNTILNGREIITGESINMPNDSSTFATTKSITINGMKSKNPI